MLVIKSTIQTSSVSLCSTKSKINVFTSLFRTHFYMLSLDITLHHIEPGYWWDSSFLFFSVSCQYCPKALEQHKWAVHGVTCWYGCNSDYGNKSYWWKFDSYSVEFSFFFHFYRDFYIYKPLRPLTQKSSPPEGTVSQRGNGDFDEFMWYLAFSLFQKENKFWNSKHCNISVSFMCDVGFIRL